jgi:hypothetical protein
VVGDTSDAKADADVVDLMAALEESLKKRRPRKRAAKKAS